MNKTLILAGVRLCSHWVSGTVTHASADEPASGNTAQPAQRCVPDRKCQSASFDSRKDKCAPLLAGSARSAVLSKMLASLMFQGEAREPRIQVRSKLRPSPAPEPKKH